MKRTSSRNPDVALRTPVVTFPPDERTPGKGKPNTTTSSPNFGGAPPRNTAMLDGNTSDFRRAKSTFGSLETICRFRPFLDARVLQPATTWLFVTMYPLSLTKNPVPNLC